MKKKEIRTPKAPLPGGPYSQGLQAGGRIYVAGQRPQDAATGDLPADFAGQAKLCLDNIRHILEEAEAGMDDVVMTRTTTCCVLRGILVEINAIAEV
jgi:2-iminobutanoate/2-iminopropanoate deaminase